MLYDDPLAYNPAKPRLMLLEKGVPFKSALISLFDGENLCPAYLRINPWGTVPSLVAGDRTLTESLQIVRYVDASLGGGGMLGGDAVDRDFVREWGAQVGSCRGGVGASAP